MSFFERYLVLPLAFTLFYLIESCVLPPVWYRLNPVRPTQPMPAALGLDGKDNRSPDIPEMVRWPDLPEFIPFRPDPPRVTGLPAPQSLEMEPSQPRGLSGPGWTQPQY